MRELTTPERVERFMQELGRAVRHPVRVYFTGGVTAILHGWRDATIDIDLKAVPESDEVLRAVSRLKEELSVNVKLAAPDQFIPEVPGWQERSLFIRSEGAASLTEQGETQRASPNRPIARSHDSRRRRGLSPLQADR